MLKSHIMNRTESHAGAHDVDDGSSLLEEGVDDGCSLLYERSLEEVGEY